MKSLNDVQYSRRYIDRFKSRWVQENSWRRKQDNSDLNDSII